MGDQFKSGLEKLSQERSLYPQESLLAVKSGKKSLFIGVPKESALLETRVTLTPEAVALLTNNGHEILIETNAGQKSKFTDQQYSEAGAQIANSAKEVFEADIILKIEPPTIEELEHITKPGKTLFSALQLANLNAEFIKQINTKKITSIAFDLIEDKVGGMPIVRAMSEIAGSTVMLVAGEYLSSINKGKGIILGGVTGVPPTKVIILGAGTVAEYAARAAIGLGAQIEVYDNHVYKLRRIKHLLGQQIYTSSLDSVTLGESMKTADVVIGAVRPEKGVRKIVVTEDMVAAMPSDSIIIDVTIDSGGCFETSEMTNFSKPVFRKYGVIHYCVPNIPSIVARTATMAISNIITPILLKTAEEGGIEDMIFSHNWFMKGVYSYKGSLTNAGIRPCASTK